jgi:hypothetical protein
LGDLAAPASEKQPQHSREGEIGEGKQHPLMLPEPTTGNAGTSTLSFGTPQPAAGDSVTIIGKIARAKAKCAAPGTSVADRYGRVSIRKAVMHDAD